MSLDECRGAPVFCESEDKAHKKKEVGIKSRQSHSCSVAAENYRLVFVATVTVARVTSLRLVLWRH